MPKEILSIPVSRQDYTTSDLNRSLTGANVNATYLAVVPSEEKASPLNERPTLGSLWDVIVARECFAPHARKGCRLEQVTKGFVRARDIHEGLRVAQQEDLFENAEGHIE